MNSTLLKALIALVPAGLLFIRATFLLRREATAARVMQLFGSACLVIVVLTHMAEALHVMLFMGGGEPHSAGHYLDLTSATLGVARSQGAICYKCEAAQTFREGCR